MYPQSFVVHDEAIGGTIYITKLEKVELMDGEIHQECSLEDSRKSRHGSWPVDFFVLIENMMFVCNSTLIWTLPANDLEHIYVNNYVWFHLKMNNIKMLKRTSRDKRKTIKDKLIFTNDLNLIAPYADYDICIDKFIYRLGRNDVILFNKNIGFALIQYNDFCPINIKNDPYCLDVIYINDNQRGKSHGRRWTKLILNDFPIVIHTLDSSLGFFEHVTKDLDLEKTNTDLPFGNTFISSNLNVNRLPIVNNCIGGCGRKISGYKTYACPKWSIRVVIENTDKDLIELNKFLRYKFKKYISHDFSI